MKEREQKGNRAKKRQSGKESEGKVKCETKRKTRRKSKN